MDKKGKLLLALLLLVVILLAILVSFVSYKVSTIETSIQNIALHNQSFSKPTNGINGKDGVDGISIKGDTGDKGVDGIDSKSTNTIIEKTFFTPIKGDEGKPGKDAPFQEIRVNSDTKNLETRKSTDRFWETLIRCSELIKSCPEQVIEESIGKK